MKINDYLKYTKNGFTSMSGLLTKFGLLAKSTGQTEVSIAIKQLPLQLETNSTQPIMNSPSTTQSKTLAALADDLTVLSQLSPLTMHSHVKGDIRISQPEESSETKHSF